MINILRKCVIGAMVREEVEENCTMEPSISTFSEPDSEKSLVIIKNDLIDFFFRFILSIHNFFLMSRHTRRRNRNMPQ
jgi:hypothetical protein